MEFESPEVYILLQSIVFAKYYQKNFKKDDYLNSIEKL